MSLLTANIMHQSSLRFYLPTKLMTDMPHNNVSRKRLFSYQNLTSKLYLANIAKQMKG